MNQPQALRLDGQGPSLAQGQEFDGLAPAASGVPHISLLTTKEVLAKLQVTAATLYNYIRSGYLHPIKKGNVNFFNALAVDTFCEALMGRKGVGRLNKTFKAIPPPIAPGQRFTAPSVTAVEKPPEPSKPEKKAPEKKRSGNESESAELGAKAAAATRLFNEHKGVREAVAELEITYELANHLYKSWKEAGPELYLTPKQVSTLQVRFDWFDTPTADGLVRAMNAYMQREIERGIKEHFAQIANDATRSASVAGGLATSHTEGVPGGVATTSVTGLATSPTASAPTVEPEKAPSTVVDEPIPEKERLILEQSLLEDEAT